MLSAFLKLKRKKGKEKGKEKGKDGKITTTNNQVKPYLFR